MHMTGIWWDLTSTLVLVLSLIRASCAIRACASAALACHSGADHIALMSIRTVKSCFHFIVSSQNLTYSVMLKVVSLWCITVCVR